MDKLVIFVVGPQQAGKTALSNYIAEISESLSSSEYHPTQGLRILEFERKLSADEKKGQKWRDSNIDVQLWDCSGDPRFADCWTSFKSQCNGIVYVLNPDAKNEKELDAWQETFPELTTNQSLIYAVRNQGTSKKVKFINKVLSKVHVSYTSFDQDPEQIKTEFDALLGNVYSSVLEQREKEEAMIAGK